MSTEAVTLPVPAPPTSPAPEGQKKKSNIMDSALMLVVTRKWIPQTKTITNKILSSTAESKMISVTKKLFDCKELKDIVSNQTKLDEYLKRRSSPLPLKKSHHLVAYDLFHEVEGEINEFFNRHRILVDKFVDVYDEAVNEAKELLGDQFNPEDYPTKEQVKGYFYFGWEWLEFKIAERLKEIDKEAAERQELQREQKIIQAGEACTALLTQQMQKILEHLVDRLTPVENEDGELKRKTFRTKMLDPINDFLAVYDARVLGQQTALTPLVEKVKGLMGGASVQQLKDNPEFRNNLEKEIATIKEQVDKMVIEQPLRSISFDEE